MIRLFVALELPEAIRHRLHALGGGVPGARWVEPANLHLTLRFIGEVEESWLEMIDEALAGIAMPPFDLVLDGIGQFGTASRPRVLWVGVARSDPLVHLHQKIESALVRVGLMPEERKFAPHVTLARLKDSPPERVGRFIQERSPFRTEPIPVRHFTLFASHLTRTGPIYSPLQEYPLTPGLLIPK